MRLLTLVPVCSLLGLLGGCSSFVQNMVDTQPRSTISASDLEHPDQLVKGRVVGYLPSPEALRNDDSSPMDPDLARYAPVLIQGFQRGDGDHAKYAINDDAIGSPYITADERTTKINTDQPTLYWQVDHANVDGESLKQLVYVFWYPRRPVGSIETGAIDGGILRITLDATDQPAVFEYAQTCGCYHGVFVTKDIEESAQEQFGNVEDHREHAVEPAITGHDDWVVRDVVETQTDTRPVLFLSAGKHFLVDIALGTQEQINSMASDESNSYQLAAYDTLDAAPRVGGGTGSIFNDQGLVKGAKRGQEQLVMGDLDHAGWPRRLDQMHIHWDADEWTDPGLLANHLRLPDTIVSDHPHRVRALVEQIPTTGRLREHGSSGASRASVSSPSGSLVESSGQDHQLLLFTDTRCTGCQLTKQIMKNSQEIHDAMGGWDFTLIDTATKDGAQIAAEHRITLVPTLVGIAHHKELMRSNELESKGTILHAIDQITHASTHS